MTSSPVAAQSAEDRMLAMEQAMANAQAQASRPGDEALTCEQLEAEMVAVMQDPAVQATVAAQGADAQLQMDRMNAARDRARAQMGVSLFMGLASAFIPGAGYAQMIQQQAMANQSRGMAEQRMAEMNAMAERMVPIMPQMFRGQRIYELAQGHQCAFVQETPAP
jgi:hypothetical protein